MVRNQCPCFGNVSLWSQFAFTPCTHDNHQSVYDHTQLLYLREFEMALQHKSKLCIYKELRGEIGLDEYLEYVVGAHASFAFLNFILVLMAF